MTFSKAFGVALLERALKTFAQSLGAILLAEQTDILTADWTQALSAAGMAAILSMLTSIATGVATDGNPSIGSPEVLSQAGQTADPVTGEDVEVIPIEPEDASGMPRRARD